MTQIIDNGPTVTVAASLTERCDRCAAAAKLVVTIAGAELAFCGHHANKYAERFSAVAERVVIESGFDWHGAG